MSKTKNINLPTVIANVVVRYEKLTGKALRVARANNHPDFEPVRENIEVEVMTVHFNKQSMRVRFHSDMGLGGGIRVQTADISAQPFFEKYGMVLV